MYNTIKLEKGLYSITGKSFTQALSELDPDSNYAGTELEGLDAFERQLKRFDIKVSGRNSDRAEKFFASTESAVLFPEYVRRTIRQGIEEYSILDSTAAAVSYLDSIDFRALIVTSNDTSMSQNQGGKVPEGTVYVDSSATEMTKFGKGFKFSYETIRKQRLEALNVILKRLGAQISQEINKHIVENLTKDENTAVFKGSSITYDDLSKFWSSMNKCNMSVMICSPATLAMILSLDEMKHSHYDFLSNGNVITPFGITIVKCNGITDKILMGIDKSCGFEAVFGTDVIVDIDKLVTTQCNEITATVTLGVAPLIKDAIKVLKPSSTT